MFLPSRQLDHFGVPLGLRVQASVLFSQPVDRGVQLVDPRQSLAEQKFQPLDMAALVFELAAQAADRGLERVIFLF